MHSLSNQSKQSNISKVCSAALLGLAVGLLYIPAIEARLDAKLFVLSFTALAAALSLTRLSWLTLSLNGFLIATYAVFALSPLSNHLAKYFIVEDRLPQEMADAIVVLSAEWPLKNRLKSQGLERLLHGKDLLRQGLAKQLVCTDLPTYRGDSRADRAKILGAENERVVSLGPAENTFQEAQMVASLAAKNNWQSIILVTSPLHSRRAKAIFTQQLTNLRVISSPAPAREFDLGFLFTSYEKLKVARLLVYETMAWLKNIIKGRVDLDSGSWSNS